MSNPYKKISTRDSDTISIRELKPSIQSLCRVYEKLVDEKPFMAKNDFESLFEDKIFSDNINEFMDKQPQLIAKNKIKSFLNEFEHKDSHLDLLEKEYPYWEWQTQEDKLTYANFKEFLNKLSVLTEEKINNIQDKLSDLDFFKKGMASIRIPFLVAAIIIIASISASSPLILLFTLPIAATLISEIWPKENTLLILGLLSCVLITLIALSAPSTPLIGLGFVMFFCVSKYISSYGKDKLNQDLKNLETARKDITKIKNTDLSVFENEFCHTIQNFWKESIKPKGTYRPRTELFSGTLPRSSFFMSSTLTSNPSDENFDENDENEVYKSTNLWLLSKHETCPGCMPLLNYDSTSSRSSSPGSI